MSDKKKYRVTVKNQDFSYSVELKTSEEVTMEQFKNAAIRKIKKQYGVDVPKNIELELLFEIIE